MLAAESRADCLLRVNGVLHQIKSNDCDKNDKKDFDIIEEKSVKPMLAAVAPANMMISAASGVPGQQQSTVVRFHRI